tara:strand:- start:114 stop:302 length:189 start_codon:yes stop_codon:yes gene_type:complete
MTSSFRNNMSFLLHSKKSREIVEKMIKKHVDQMRKTYSWDGENKEVTKEILNYLRWGERSDK